MKDPMSGEEAMRILREPSGWKPGCQPRESLVFSLEDGFVWASWPGAVGSVRLGHYSAVTPVMQDFLDQSELGERLAKKQAPGSSTAGAMPD